MDYDDYEEIDAPSCLEKYFKWWVSVLALPVLYLFIYIPLSSFPEYIQFDELSKFNTLSNASAQSTYDRLILIGDVHGCYDELLSLLKKAEYDEEKDQVLLLGDFISKGPKSPAVLDYAIAHNFSAVLGNHELAILSKYQASRPVLFDDGEKYALEVPGDIKRDSETRLARHLTPEQVRYIASLPLVMDIGPVNGFRGIACHVGISLEQPLEEQSINAELAMEKDKWFSEYNSAMKKMKKDERSVVFYGHAASIGLNIHKYTKGLDSSCVKGGQLTAMILSEEGEEQELVQVKCEQYI